MSSSTSRNTNPRLDSQLDSMVRASANEFERSRVVSMSGVPTLLCASGRGGSGTSLISALIAVAAAGNGQRVMLIDGDDLVGPQTMLLGAKPWAGWQDLRGGRVQVSDIATPISASLTLIAGGAPRRAAEGASTTPNSAERRACLRRVSTLAQGHDLVVVDCGARLETLLAAVAPQLHERVLAITSGSDPIALASTFALCKATHTRFPGLKVDVVVNRHDVIEGSKCFDAIDAGARQFLPQLPLRFAGSVPLDSTLDAVLRAGMPFLDAASGSPAAHAALDIALNARTAKSSSRLGV